ncbi:hydroxymethylbilane synthase [Flexithrix dorotheae]|uniref:hydroxymethylbilane synthase n=1 Tax=Flexithrix dorotheae TaxID=70993 RepID=UPI000378A1DE|nr:hydroxymethylbilane synthase [Flexithrix dorotheae]
MAKIRIGTRGSKLALWQAYYIESLLKEKGHETEIVTIETKGDKILDRALSKVGGKGVFTEELEEQLTNKKIDIAVHSAKDLQSDLGPDFKIIAFTERELVHDVIVSYDKNCLKKESPVLGTSSVRRTAMVKHYLPNCQTVNMRGNLQTRLKKLKEGQCDALILAYAGVHRMEYNNLIVQELNTEEFTPPVGQGSVAIEVSTGIEPGLEGKIREAVNHKASEYCLLAERAFLKKLEGGCSIPAFGNAVLSNNSITLTGGIISPDGTQLVKKEIKGDLTNAETLGTSLAITVLENGGREILEELKVN